MEHSSWKGDIWRMCQTRDLPIQDWIKLRWIEYRAAWSSNGILV
jgi:monomeric isocitrate dehydrogenase